MALGKLFNLFALSSLAVLVCNLGAMPVNALAHDGHHMVKVKRAHGHDGVAKRKRDQSQRCRPRTTSSAPASTSTPETTSQPPADTSSWAEPAPSSSSAAPPATTSTSTGGGGGKFGLAWPNGDDSTLQQYISSQTKYIYTWSEHCPSDASGLTCMPMLWGGDQDRLNAFKSTVVAGYANIAMGFNEVNEVGQANLDVDTALNLWWNYLEPLVDDGYQLVAPVTSSNPNGFTWMQDFVGKCSQCHISYMPIHFYGTSPQDMIDYIEKWYNEFHLPIMVTEYACQNFNTANENNGQQCSESQVWNFHSTVVKYMESNANVVMYSPFGVMRNMQGVNTLNQLMGSDGLPTALGYTYLNNNFQ